MNEKSSEERFNEWDKDPGQIFTTYMKAAWDTQETYWVNKFDLAMTQKNAEIKRLREALKSALASFSITQTISDYPMDHWSNLAVKYLKQTQPS